MAKKYILALETATLCGSVAIWENSLLGEISINITKTHSQRLLKNIDYLLRETQVKLKEILAIAISIGPGSFTGLRIGLATAKGLSLGLSVPLLGINTLEAMVYNVPKVSYDICPLLDARRKQVYTGIYRFHEGDLQEIMSPSLLTISNLLKFIKRRTLFLGNGLYIYEEFLRKNLKAKFLKVPAHLSLPRAASLAFVAYKKWKKKEFDLPQNIQPLYLRPSEAERNFILGVKRCG